MARRSLQLACTALFMIALLAFAYAGHFSRYMADDYCTTNIALTQGIPGSVAQLYNGWAGQYTNWTVKSIVAYLGTGFPGVIPTLLLLLWTGGAVWTIQQIVIALRLSSDRALTWLLGLMAVFAVFAGIPSVIQSLYWLGASIPYTLPLAGLIFYVGYFVREMSRGQSDRIPVRGVVVILLITVISGGTSEVFAAFQIAVTGLILLAALAAPTHLKRSAFWLSSAGLAGAMLALVLIAIAPGTAVRQAAFTTHLPLTDVAVQTVLAAASYIVLAIGVFSPLPLLIAVIFPAVTVSQLVPPDSGFRLNPKQVRRGLLLSLVVAFILLMASFAPSIYAVSATPPARVYIYPQLVMVCTAGCWGVLMGLGSRRGQGRPNRLAVFLVMALLAVGCGLSALQTLATTPQWSTYAAEWDARDQTIRAAVASGAQEIDVKMLTVDMGAMAALDTIGPDPTGWVNRCAESYYGVKALSAETPVQMGDKES